LGPDGDGRRALEAAGARGARPLRAGLLLRRDPQVAPPLAGYVAVLPCSLSSQPASRLTAASRLQITPGGSTACGRDRLPAIGMCVNYACLFVGVPYFSTLSEVLEI
jgi:hypothetical protein